MRALSIRQPWAWLIVNGHKDVENRTWSTNVRGRILVHASKGVSLREYDEAMNWIALNSRIAFDFPEPGFRNLERGGIVGAVEIVDCVDRSDSPWFVGPYGFVLCNARPLPFQPCKGALGFFTPNTKVRDAGTDRNETGRV